MAKQTAFLAYKAECEVKDGKPFSVKIYSNRDVVGPTLSKERLHPGVKMTIEQDVKTEIIKLYHPKNIVLTKCF